MKNAIIACLTTWLTVVSLQTRGMTETTNLNEQLASSGFKVIHESYVDQNWELFLTNPDGSASVNLTHTKDQHELYPQVSPDGSQICYVSDRGQGRSTIRSVWVMNADGSNPHKIADYARQPFWHPNGYVIGYLPQEYKKFNVVDFSTDGIAYHNLKTGESRPHPNSENLHHLYNPNFSPDGKWIVSTVHAGMGFKHAILLIEAEGDKIVNLEIPGCRPSFSPDGKSVAWGPGDHEIAVADLDFSGDLPKIKPKRISILDEKLKIYHVDWSPDGKFLSISRGPESEGDISNPGTHSAACEIVGVHAKGWDLIAVSAQKDGILDLPSAESGVWIPLTHNGNSNKESAWILTR